MASPWLQTNWGLSVSGLEPHVEITEGHNPASTAGVSFGEEWGKDFQISSRNSSNYSRVEAKEQKDGREVPVKVCSGLVHLKQGRIRAKNGQTCDREKQQNGRRQRPISYKAGSVRQVSQQVNRPQVTLSVTRTKVFLRRGKPPAPPSEDYSFKCQLCPFASNQTSFLTKHIARHHKSTVF
jgi:hypothetical protein